MDNWFEELSSMRQEWVEITRRNNFEKGIRHSTIEKYPDPVHFVYELLQNAEDQCASKAQFQLFADHLVFCHNGNPFTRADVENITGIGNSDKPQEANKIGRFGIGFKSVFAITERPEIYTVLEDKPFAFAIEHLVVPVAIPGNGDKSHLYNTQFIFPFLIGQERSHYTKIREKLSSLGFETLLFLHHLASIEWQTETDDGVYLREVKGARHELFGKSRENGQLQQSSANYLVFRKSVDLSEDDRELDVRVAFKLDKQGEIIAEPGQKLAVYFPTEQVTGLNFRVHGPFLLTDNRANIKIDNDTNNRLIQECAVLLSESIQQIKVAGLLTIDFLSLLPIRKDHIPALFLPLYDQVLQTLKQYPLLPTVDGTFASATQAKLARNADLRELINGRQLSALYDEASDLLWLSSDVTLDRTPELYKYIIRDLGVEVVRPETFIQRIERSFVEKQTDEWLIQFYTFLGKQPDLKSVIKQRFILRLEDNNHVPPFDPHGKPNAYLLREGNSELPLVKRTLLVDDTVYAFLKGIGLSEPDVVDEVLNFILPPYEAYEIALDDEFRNKRDLDYIQKALECRNHHARQELISRLNKTPFLQAINAKTSERAWKAPCEVYSKTEELLTWFEGNEHAWFIAGLLPGSLLNDLNIRTHLQPEARVATGSTGYVAIWDGHGDHRRGLHGFDPSARLDGLQYAIDHMTPDKASMLWNVLLEHRHLIKGVVETSTQRNFSDPRRGEKCSSMGRLCSQKAWLPDKNGDFHSPEDLFLTELPECFEKSTDEARELAIKLGRRKAEELQLADKLGIPHNAISLIQHDPDAFIEWYEEQQRRKVPLPSSITNDTDRRREKAAGAAYNAEEKTYKAITMNRRVSAGTNDPKAYLRSHNTNEDGQLICQLCDLPMPFRLPNGEEYFEAYQYSEILGKEYEANHLALCPNCAAEFKHACQTDENKKAELILDLNSAVDEANLVVHLVMPVHRCLRFTQRHLIDLQEAIQDWLKAGLEAVE